MDQPQQVIETDPYSDNKEPSRHQCLMLDRLLKVLKDFQMLRRQSECRLLDHHDEDTGQDDHQDTGHTPLTQEQRMLQTVGQQGCHGESDRHTHPREGNLMIHRVEDMNQQKH